MFSILRRHRAIENYIRCANYVEGVRPPFAPYIFPGSLKATPQSQLQIAPTGYMIRRKSGFVQV